VKVQRPEIRAAVEQDLDILLRLAARLEEHARWARAVGAVGVARGFGAAIGKNSTSAWRHGTWPPWPPPGRRSSASWGGASRW
jgi:hypothetical protein